MMSVRIGILLAATAGLGALAPAGNAQAAAGTGFSSTNVAAPTPDKPQPQLEPAYRRPTEKAKLRGYLFDTFGPYPIAGAVLVGAIDQEDKAPPEWGKGAAAYGERVGSNFGIEMVTTTTRYALAEALGEDTLYYRCECSGVFRRLGHALISTVTARVGPEGTRRFSVPDLVAPYAGTMTAVYGWYPSRFNAKDGFRMGNYDLLGFVGENIAREFIYGGPHTIFGRVSPPLTPKTESVASSNP
jgi:hypothetical protein